MRSKEQEQKHREHINEQSTKKSRKELCTKYNPLMKLNLDLYRHVRV